MGDLTVLDAPPASYWPYMDLDPTFASVLVARARVHVDDGPPRVTWSLAIRGVPLEGIGGTIRIADPGLPTHPGAVVMADAVADVDDAMALVQRVVSKVDDAAAIIHRVYTWADSIYRATRLDPEVQAAWQAALAQVAPKRSRKKYEAFQAAELAWTRAALASVAAATAAK